MSTADVYGVLRAAHFEIALPTESIEQVVSRPEILCIPDPGRYVSGALRRGDQLIPLVALSKLLLGEEDARTKPDLALIVRCGGRLAALSIDGIVKVTRPNALTLSDLESDTNHRTLFPRFFRDPESGEAVAILDPAALFAHDGIRSLADRPAAEAEHTSTSGKLKLACFRCSGCIFALDISNVVRAIHAEENTITPIGMSFVPSYWELDGAQTPMLNLPRFLRLPQPSTSSRPTRGLLIRHESRQIGIEIDDVLGAIEIHASAIASIARSGIPNAEVYRGILRRGSDSILVLDLGALLEHDQIRSIAVAAASPADHTREAGQQQSFVVYESGRGLLASALRDMEGIIPLPELLSLGQSDAVFQGFLEWRGQSVSVLDLGALLGNPLEYLNVSRSVLITRSGDELHGFVVPRVESLVLAAPQPVPPIACKDFPNLTQMIQLSAQGIRRNVMILDLLALTAPAIP